MAYERTPGPAFESPLHWPLDSSLEPNESNGTLIVFAHPYCPCSRAGLTKLEHALAVCEARPACYVFLSPMRSTNDSLDDATNCRIARRITSAPLQVDTYGAEAKRFGATTSGFVLFYDAHGRLRFAGGVTAERGGEQECVYEQALVEVMTKPRYPLVNTPVFGCPLVRRTSG